MSMKKRINCFILKHKGNVMFIRFSKQRKMEVRVMQNAMYFITHISGIMIIDRKLFELIYYLQMFSF